MKFLLIVLTALALTGCAALSSTPTSAPTPTPWPTHTPTLVITKTWVDDYANGQKVAYAGCESESMAPAISCDDKIIYQPDYDPQEVDVGDIVMFSPSRVGVRCSARLAEPNQGAASPLMRVVHRVIDVQPAEEGVWPQPRRVRTKGDNNLIDDGCWISVNHLIGVVVEVKK